MLRKLIIGLFILTSLAAQASTAFACKLTGQVVAHHCCCDGVHKAQAPGAGDEPCCETIVLVGDQGGSSTSAAKQPLPDVQPQTPGVVLAIALPRASFAPAWIELPAVTPRSGTLTYLHTQRLRI